MYDQGNCKSSYAIAVASAASDRICIHSGGSIKPRLSAQQILSCCYLCGYGCGGGQHFESWDFYRRHGLVSGGGYGSDEVNVNSTHYLLVNVIYTTRTTTAYASIVEVLFLSCFIYLFFYKNYLPRCDVVERATFSFKIPYFILTARYRALLRSKSFNCIEPKRDKKYRISLVRFRPYSKTSELSTILFLSSKRRLISVRDYRPCT